MSVSENKCCGNCKHFNNEDVEGWGWCALNKTKTQCAQSWDCYNSTFNGWTEITPDNVDELYDKPIAVAWKYEDKTYYSLAGDCALSLSTMAKYGGYYYMELPELKIE